jgi:hypothetical protein
MPLNIEQIQELSTPHVLLSSDATVGDAVRACVHRKGQWWWVLVVQDGEQYGICSYGSLLPYLTGRTPHIVHNVGDCAICSGMDSLLWRETGSLVDEVMADEDICARRLSELPTAPLRTVAAEEINEDRLFATLGRLGPAVGLTLDGAWAGVHVVRTRDLGGIPAF